MNTFTLNVLAAELINVVAKIIAIVNPIIIKFFFTNTSPYSFITFSIVSVGVPLLE